METERQLRDLMSQASEGPFREHALAAELQSSCKDEAAACVVFLRSGLGSTVYRGLNPSPSTQFVHVGT